MKKWVYLFLFCCYLPFAAQENAGDSIKTYMDEARQGKVSAYERLAEYYHRGEGMERNFMNMIVMYSWAADLGGRPVAAGMKRSHDTDKSGWLILLGLIPVVNFVLALYMLFADGTVGPNRYGLDPKNRMPYNPSINVNVNVNAEKPVTASTTTSSTRSYEF